MTQSKRAIWSSACVLQCIYFITGLTCEQEQGQPDTVRGLSTARSRFVVPHSDHGWVGDRIAIKWVLRYKIGSSTGGWLVARLVASCSTYGDVYSIPMRSFIVYWLVLILLDMFCLFHRILIQPHTVPPVLVLRVPWMVAVSCVRRFAPYDEPINGG